MSYTAPVCDCCGAPKRGRPTHADRRAAGTVDMFEGGRGEEAPTPWRCDACAMGPIRLRWPRFKTARELMAFDRQLTGGRRYGAQYLPSGAEVFVDYRPRWVDRAHLEADAADFETAMIEELARRAAEEAQQAIELHREALALLGEPVDGPRRAAYVPPVGWLGQEVSPAWRERCRVRRVTWRQPSRKRAPRRAAPPAALVQLALL